MFFHGYIESGDAHLIPNGIIKITEQPHRLIHDGAMSGKTETLN